ncbi:MAG TPA: MazG nucleotide pyrophosphohydrolase domain-containing protein [Bacillales bacterium]|nr:MazG nucleotide pyrophosphohydrolase domain-containing protein [Bacillales bacterium]
MQSLSELQAYIRTFDHRTEKKLHYFLKLSEEVGELAEVLRKDQRLADTGELKGTVEEELCDVLYYVLALANVYDIDLEACFQQKDELNKVKWGR